MKTGTKVIIIVSIVVLCLAAAGLGWWIGKQKQTESTQNPANTENAQGETQEVTPAPEAMPTPEITEVPSLTEAPAETEVPVTTEAPVETEVPEVTTTPDVTTAPDTPETTPVPEEPESTPAPQETPKPETTGTSKLHVEGAKLCDENGNQVQLRGISTHGLAWFPQYVNEACVKELKETWEADVFRLAMYTAENGGYCTGGDKEALKKLVKNGVEYATANDLYVIIDWHILSDNNPNTYKEESKAFFDEMSKLYKDYPNVIFEICNEPNGGTSWQDVKSYAEEVIKVIRDNGADNIIIVGTPNWSQYVDQAAADPITAYDNIMYALHYYAATHKDDLRQKMVNAYNAGLPVFVSEYGICDASGNGAIDKAQADAWVAEMDRYGISYVAWNLSNKNETSAIIKSSCNKTSGFSWDDLSESGKWLFTVLTGESGFTGSVPDEQPDTPTNPSVEPQPGETDVVVNGTVEVTLELKDSWVSEGYYCYNYNITVKNTSDKKLENWEAQIVFNENIVLNQGWSGTYTVNGNVLKISPVNYNSTIEAGQSVSDIGCIIQGSSNLQVVE